MQGSLTLSVIVPVFNERTLVESSLRRLLVLGRSPMFAKVQVIVVDDGSSDGSAEVLRRCRAGFAKGSGKMRWLFLAHGANRGKGAAFRTGLARAEGEVTVIHDADLEYFPEDLPDLMLPFVKAGADAVYGSRFLPRRFRAVTRFRHELLNRGMTFFSNLVTNYNLTDSATCYKAVRTELLKSIPLGEDDFRFEPELTVKLSRRGARLFEVPISYAGRSLQEGKKLRWTDGFKAAAAYLRHSLSDNLFSGPSGEANLFARLNRATHYQQWMLDLVRPWVGQSVLEIGAKTGHLSAWLLPRDRYWAVDANPDYLASLHSLAFNKPYVHVARAGVDSLAALPPQAKGLDTVLCLNALASAKDPQAAVKALCARLAPGGRLVIFEPQGHWLFGSRDRALGYLRRFSAADLRAMLQGAGMTLEAERSFNRAGSLPWWLDSVALKRENFGLFQVLVADRLTVLFKLVDTLLPLPALSRLAVGRKGP